LKGRLKGFEPLPVAFQLSRLSTNLPRPGAEGIKPSADKGSNELCALPALPRFALYPPAITFAGMQSSPPINAGKAPCGLCRVISPTFTASLCDTISRRCGATSYACPLIFCCRFWLVKHFLQLSVAVRDNQ